MRVSLRFIVVPALALATVLSGPGSVRADVPAGFQDTLFVSGIAEPSALGFAPDGRLFVLEKGNGRVRVVKNGTLLPTEFLDLNSFIAPPQFLDNFFERGLLGIAFDPSFASNQFVYLYYTLCKVPSGGGCQTAVNRVARFVANGDVVEPGSQTVIIDDIPNDAGNHNAGWIGFGPDGKLYASVGDGGAVGTKAQDVTGLNGKVLRVNADGSIPADNPFVGSGGRSDLVWAYGFRNPWRLRFQPVSGRLFCADVGQNAWEEIDIVQPGLNFGWPTVEGPFTPATWPAFTHPIHSYNHNGGRASITGGDFGSRTNFPGDHQQSYYFGDYALGFIQRAILDAAGTTVLDVQDFVTNIGTDTVTDIIAGPDGSLYYTNFSADSVRKIEAVASNRSPIAVAAATPDHGPAPLSVQFSSAGSSDPDGDPITFTWSFGDGTPDSNAADPLHQYAAEGAYTATLTVSDGQPVPGPGIDTVGIAVGNPPVVTITAPLEGDIHQAGDTVSLLGSADDPEDGPLSPSALHWKIVFHHRSHTHPFIDDLVGSPQSFVWATAGEPDWVVSYEVILSATDTSGLTGSASVFVVPQLTDFVLGTDPQGLELHLDGQPITTPLTVTGVVGYPRTIEAPSPLAGGTQSWLFSQWSDGGAAVHDIVTPAGPTTYTVAYTNACDAPTVIPPGGATVAGATSGTNTLAGTCAATDAAPEQVFAWTPAISGTATIQTCGGSTNFDTVVYLRSGTCGTGTEVACNDDTAACSSGSGPNHGSRITPTVTAGQTYYIVVDGINGIHAAGNFTLTVVPPVLGATSTTSTSSTTSSTNSTALTTTTSTTSSTAIVTTTSTTGTAPTTSSTSTSSTSSSSTSATSTSSTSVSTTSSTSTTEPLCGNGVLDPGEQCDDGNHLDNDCCSSSCRAARRGTPCGDGGQGECDAPDSCDSTGHCQANHVAVGTPCADDGEVCTTDQCGLEGECEHLPGHVGAECRVKGTNDECDAGDVCDGVSPTCPLGGLELGCTTDLPTEVAGKMIPVTCETQGDPGGGDASSCEAVGFEVTAATVAAVTRGNGTIERPLDVGRQVTKRVLKFGKGGLGTNRRLVLRLRLNALGKRLLRQQGQLKVLVAVRVQSDSALRDLRRLVTLRR